MQRRFCFRFSVLLVALLGLPLAACDDDDNGGPSDTGQDVVTDVVDDTTTDTQDEADQVVDPRVAACQAAIATREAAVADELEDWPVDDAPEMVADPGGDQSLEADYAGHYRDDLPNHPGCEPRDAYPANAEFLILDNEATVPAGEPADFADYPCAAKVYDQANENEDLPIVILVHGNSSGVNSFEEYFVAARASTELTTSAAFTFTTDAAVRQQLASALLEAGYAVISFDARTDLVNTLTDFNPDTATGNAFRNIDHGWAVPMLMDLIKTVMTDNPDRMVSIVGHSLGTTVVRDALRRLWIEWRDDEAGAVNPFAQLQDVVFSSGANHGVANGAVLCDSFGTQMRGTVTCEMGDRAAFVPTYFSERLNGPEDLFAAPCGDGSFAYGLRDQCEGNAVEYTTITMQDIAEGELQDEFVSEASSQLDLDPCVENVLIELSDYDSSGFFLTALPGIFASHFGSIRSDAGIEIILDRLSD